MRSKRANFRLTFAAAVVLLLAIALFLTMVLDGIGARADLTEDRLYTMSPSAARILGDLKVPVQVKFYITGTDAMPSDLKTLERDVTDKLHDYERASGGMLQFTVYDPQDDDEMQQSLSSRGIRPFQVQSIDRDEIGVKLVWSAMTIAYKDYPEEIVPQVLPQSLTTLEYELVSRIFRLTRERQPKVAMFAPLEQVDPQLAMMYMQQGMQPPQPQDLFRTVVQLLEQEHYQVDRIELTETSRIPDDADVLLVLYPRDLNDRQVFEINRALSNGLDVVLAVQPHEYDYQPGQRGGFTIVGRSAQSGVDGMLGSFGVTVDKDHFFDENLVVLSVPRTQNVGGLRFQTTEPVRAPVQVQITQDQFNPDASITNRISSLLYLWGSTLELDRAALAAAELDATTLFSSSDRAWTTPFNDGPVPGSDFDPRNHEMQGPMPLAVMLRGEFPDSFQGRELPEWPADPAAADDAEAAPPAPDRAPELDPAPATLMVFGSAKMFDDMVMPMGHQNPLLLLNAVDSLAYGEDLISIRSKIVSQRTIKAVGDSEKLFFRVFAVVLMPVLLVAYGIFRAGVRRKDAALYRENLSRR